MIHDIARPPADPFPGRGIVSTARIPIEGVVLNGVLAIPALPVGVVLFAHGNGSGRGSPRNGAVASRLNREGIATLLLDLVDDEECEFDLNRSVHRLKMATLWLKGTIAARFLPVGFFGAGRGAAVALRAAAEFGGMIRAVVCRGGRPELLAELDLDLLETPALFIVGAKDPAAVESNRKAFEQISGPKEFSIVPGAGHLFEEPGALDDVAARATAWFRRQFASRAGWAGIPMS